MRVYSSLKILMCAWVILVSPAWAGAAETILRFTLDSPSASFKDLTITEEGEDGTTNSLAKGADNVIKLVAPHDAFKQYYKRILLQIHVSKVDPTQWPINFANLKFELGVILRRDDPSVITIPFVIPAKLNEEFLSQLEKKASSSSFNDALSGYIQAGITYIHFRDSLGATDPYSKRANRIWFDLAYKLATQHKRRFYLTDDLTSSREASLAGSDDEILAFRAQVQEIKSLIFVDINRFDRGIARAQCDDAIAMLQELEDLGTSNGELLTLRRITLKDVSGRLSRARAKCASTLTR